MFDCDSSIKLQRWQFSFQCLEIMVGDLKIASTGLETTTSNLVLIRAKVAQT